MKEGRKKQSQPQSGCEEDAGYYYHMTLKTGRRIFADEVDKQQLLSIVDRHTLAYGCTVIGFVLLDDRLDLLVRTERMTIRPDRGMIRDILEGFTDYFDERYHWPGRSADTLQEQVACYGVRDLDDAAECCRQMHNLPREEGYARTLQDYWWSSFQSYRGQYQWSFVQPERILHQFSDNDAEARKRFIRFQKGSLSMLTAKKRRTRSKSEPKQTRKASGG